VVARPSPRISQLRALRGAYERLSVVNGDLSSLSSIAKACDQIQGMLGSDRIDVLGLNAGVQVVRGDASSADGLELSFAVNFLAHFLIVERLKWLLRPGSRIVFTSSEVHDPDAFCLMGITRATWSATYPRPLGTRSHLTPSTLTSMLPRRLRGPASRSAFLPALFAEPRRSPSTAARLG